MADQSISKICTHCKCDLPVTSFGIAKAYRDGRRSQCNKCRTILGRGRWKTERHRERRAARRVDNLVEERRKDRERKRKQNYGLSAEDIDLLLAQQGGGCALCKTTKPGGRYDVFCVDHCHETGRVRGMLCHSCNVALGALGDNEAGLAAALAYVIGDTVSARASAEVELGFHPNHGMR